MTLPKFRIFILGAGFSCPAGLPLARELFGKIREIIERDHGRDTKFQRDVDSYLDYEKAVGSEIAESDIDLEKLMSYLDIEHFMRLRGSDTWSSEGNESQIMIRRAIGEVIHSVTPDADKLPDIYYQFARQLSPNDLVLTFNYDVILERSLDHIGKLYRLSNFEEQAPELWAEKIVTPEPKLTIFKLHGSLDWFSDFEFLEAKKQGAERVSHHGRIFSDPRIFGMQEIAPYAAPDDPIRHIYRMDQVDKYYRYDCGFTAPFILSPSYLKFVYADPLVSLWSGLGQTGGWNHAVSVIGFSLPEHDDYIRLLLYKLISNYQCVEWEEELYGHFKDYVRFVDFHTKKSGCDAFIERYKFVDPSRAKFFFDGFSEGGLDFIFNHCRSG